jgi:nucleoid-associated protein YgaU
MGKEMQRHLLWSYLCIVAAALSVLAALWPDPRAIARGLAAPHAWIASSGADAAAAAVAGAALWCVAAWLTVGLCAGLLAALPGAVGRAAAIVTRALLPAAIRRVLAGVTGLTVLVTPAAAGARGVLPSPGWPSSAAPPAASQHAPSDPTRGALLPAPSWPVSAALPEARRPPPLLGAATTVRVRPGDALWRIAARRLATGSPAASIAAACHRLYADNRTVIGSDPDLIHPGQLLRISDTDPKEPSS